MDSTAGISGIADVQARIAAIQARFSAGGGASATASQSSTSKSLASSLVDSATSSQPDFAKLLSNVDALKNASSTSATSTAGSVLPRAATTSNITASRTQFAHDLLAKLGMPDTAENVRAIKAWAQAEGTDAGFNPLATTRRAAGTTDFNSVGVKNYPSYTDGVQATADTLRNGLYGTILDALSQGTSAQNVAQAIASSRWGTGDRVLHVLASNPS